MSQSGAMMRIASAPFGRASRPSMRHLAIALLLSGSGLQPAGAAESPGAVSAPSTCALMSSTYDSHDVACVIPGSGQARRFRFKATFAGGHDDTLVSIHPSLGDVELACEDGSKTRSFAEDGDIALQCDFTVVGPASVDAKFKATIRWSHAQFTAFEMRPL